MSNFDVNTYYHSYPLKVLQRPGYPARAQYKSTLLWTLFGNTLLKEAKHIEYYADVGGCFGFGANAMSYHITKSQGSPPKTTVYEISDDFILIGSKLFPDIEFIKKNISDSKNLHVFDLITMFDVIEHIENPFEFLKNISKRTRFLLLKTPMETSGEWRKKILHPNGGSNHPDGHVNFFTPKSYCNMLNECGIEIIKSKLVSTIVKPGFTKVLCPEEMYTHREPSQSVKSFLKSIVGYMISTNILPYKYLRYYWGGGDHLSLARSRHLL